MSDFVAGFAARHSLPAETLARVSRAATREFAPGSPAAVPAMATCFASEALAPRHFAPADRSHNPTQGWNPLDPTLIETPFAASPSLDPVVAAHAAGYAEGLAAARAAVDEAGDRDRALLGELVERLAAGQSIDREGIARQLRQTVLLLVGKLVGEVGVSPELLAGRVERAADHLADAAESAILRVHPDDVALLEGRLPTNLFAVGDANVARGSFVLESASTLIEDGPALWLDQLAQAVDKVAVPGC